jgi:16S rRNA (uracil1498-N3)-methyltransferase
VRTPRIFTSQPLQTGHHIQLEAEPSHHLLKVLRLRSGAQLRLFNGDGREFSASLISSDRNRVEVELHQCLRKEAKDSLPITLAIGISRGERMDFALQKSVELGVSAIVPLVTERCVVRLDPRRQQKRMTHWQKIVISACEQSGRCRVPQLEQPGRFDEMLQQLPATMRLMLDHRASESLHDLSSRPDAIVLLVGPEGGLSPEERRLAQQAGFKGVRLGPRVLRTETAPLAALAAIQTLWGDFMT